MASADDFLLAVSTPFLDSSFNLLNFVFIMHIHPLLAAVVASAPLCRAAPAPAEIAIDASVAVDATLRLIKTSETDNGTWVREDEKIENYVAKGINFVDITDITVSTCIY